MDDTLQQLTERYLSNLIAINTKELFVLNLPGMYYDSSMKIIEGILKKLEQEAEEYESYSREIQTKEDKEMLLAELSLIQQKIKWTTEYLQNEMQEQQHEEEILANNEKKYIIFATTSRATCVEEDIKNLPEEYYEKIISCLQKLESGYSEYNVEKQKKLNASNRKTKGVHEIKEFQTRVMYRILDEDTVYVQQVLLKKDDFSRKTREDIINRKSNQEKEYEKIKKAITDPILKQKLIEENEATKQNLYKYLNSNKRGGKK